MGGAKEWTAEMADSGRKMSVEYGTRRTAHPIMQRVSCALPSIKGSFPSPQCEIECRVSRWCVTTSSKRIDLLPQNQEKIAYAYQVPNKSGIPA